MQQRTRKITRDRGLMGNEVHDRGVLAFAWASRSVVIRETELALQTVLRERYTPCCVTCTEAMGAAVPDLSLC
jgi:hypothetical protein